MRRLGGLVGPASALLAVSCAAAPGFVAPGQLPTHTDELEMTWVPIPGGSFGEHEIGGFEMNRTEVSVQQYQACVEAGACTEPDSADEVHNWGKAGREHHPINGVDWSQAAAFCSWKGGRLPTEWEWEWGARGREAGHAYPWGSTEPSCRVVVMGGTRWRQAGCGAQSTWPVGRKPLGASPDGLLDLGGNVLEWTDSWYDEQRKNRVVRGGDWWDLEAKPFRADHRVGEEPATREVRIGFRCVRASGSAGAG